MLIHIREDNLLQYNANTNVTEYVNFIIILWNYINYDLSQPISNNSATVIDHVLTNSISAELESILNTSKIYNNFLLFI